MYEYIFQIGRFYLFWPLKAGSYQLIYHGIRGVQLNDFPLIHNSNAVAKLLRLIHIVCRNNYSSSVIANVSYQIPQVSSCLRIEPCSGFI